MDSTEIAIVTLICIVSLVISGVLYFSYLDVNKRRNCRQALTEQIIKGAGALPLYSPADIEQLCK